VQVMYRTRCSAHTQNKSVMNQYELGNLFILMKIAFKKSATLTQLLKVSTILTFFCLRILAIYFQTFDANEVHLSTFEGSDSLNLEILLSALFAGL
jgi:hypothetical protein